MTEAERKKFIVREVLRHTSRMWKMYPGRKEVKYADDRKFTCVSCHRIVLRPAKRYSNLGRVVDRAAAREFEVDHVEPVGKRPKAVSGLTKYLNRKFCSIDNLRLLCKKCHKEKTGSDRKKGWK